MDEDRPGSPVRDAAITFAALLGALLGAGAVAALFPPEARSLAGTLLFALLFVLYGALTRPGRDTGFGFYMAAAFFLPLSYVAVVLGGLTVLSPAPDWIVWGFNVGLFMSGGADAPYDIIMIIWALSMLPVMMLAAGVQQWLVMRRDDGA